MVLILNLIMILAITLSSLRISAIYFKWVTNHKLLYLGVLDRILVLVVGSEVGVYVGLSPVTINYIDEGLPVLTEYFGIQLFNFKWGLLTPIN